MAKVAKRAKMAKMDSAVGPQHWRQLSPFPVCALRRFDFASGLFSRLLCLRCALSRARREGAVLHGMDDPHPLMPRPPPLLVINVGQKYLGPEIPRGDCSRRPLRRSISLTEQTASLDR